MFPLEKMITHVSIEMCFILVDDSDLICDFENECHLEQDQDDDEDWVRLSTSNLPGLQDHTFSSGINTLFCTMCYFLAATKQLYE